MISIKIKRPRRPFRYFHFRLSAMSNERNGMCEQCQAFAEQAESERPGHVWTACNGVLVFVEDLIMEKLIGRKLTSHEAVMHRDGNCMNNRTENLELIVIDKLEEK